ncbi:hypothetical protein [Vibrio neptunius]|uniref:hypothetical protein n=1 Tax=Vibrio neptunius TaxID=170651 RepID=UPI0019D18B8E|nr:hypothetical protein [Vibrio neptunius]MBN3573694.1 hypothetical protein [Vibrio neptunius]
MLLVCKFVPAYTASRDMLDYLLSPDECIGQLSRAHNPKDLLAALPKPLSDAIPQSAHKDNYRLLEHIKQHLARADWLALSTFRRQHPLSEAELIAYPMLKKRIEALAAKPAKKFLKANYDAVSDDVYLAPNPKVTPVEPSPDKKIVVEVAGQLPNHAAYLMLSKTEFHYRKTAKPKQDPHNRHRSLSVFDALDESPRNLYLALPMRGLPQPLKLLLAKGVEPVDSSVEKDEWDNVLVPVVPMHFITDEKSEKSAARHMKGYIYVLWKDKIWRELEINDSGYFLDIDVDYYRYAKPGEQKPKRHADIRLTHPETGSPYCYEPFQVRVDGSVIYKGRLNDVGEARVFNIIQEEIEVVLTDFDPQVVVKVATKPSPFTGATPNYREAEGHPLPHIWIPYKILGEQQSVSLYYSESQLSLQQLAAFESDPSQATELTDIEHYSSTQSFKQSEGVTRALVMPEVSQEQIRRYLVLANQVDKTIAGTYINGPKPKLTFTYPIDTTVDELDDYFELRDTQGDWCQRHYLKDCVAHQKGIRSIQFSGWPAEVKNVDLVRVYLGQSRHKRNNQTEIFSNKTLSDLLASQSDVALAEES